MWIIEDGRWCVYGKIKQLPVKIKRLPEKIKYANAKILLEIGLKLLYTIQVRVYVVFQGG